jgi:hypothetical protein
MGRPFGFVWVVPIIHAGLATVERENRYRFFAFWEDAEVYLQNEKQNGIHLKRESGII